MSQFVGESFRYGHSDGEVEFDCVEQADDRFVLEVTSVEYPDVNPGVYYEGRRMHCTQSFLENRCDKL